MFSIPSSRISVPVERWPLILNPTPRVVEFWEFVFNATADVELPEFDASPFDTFPEIATKSYGLRVRLGRDTSCWESTNCDNSWVCVFTEDPPSAMTSTWVTLVLTES